MRDNQIRRALRGVLATLLFLAAAACAATALPARALAADAVPVYRLYNTWDGQHLITSDGGEYGRLVRAGWRGEGIRFLCPAEGADVWRLYNPYNGDHLYTADEGEYEARQRGGWQGEGVKLHGADPAEGVPVYRLYNPYMSANGGLGSHLWTVEAGEYDSLPRSGWVQEDPAWYAVRASDATVSGTVTPRSGDAYAYERDVCVEVYDAQGNCLASQDADGGSYSFKLVPGTYRIAAHCYGQADDRWFWTTDALVRSMQRDVTLSSGQSRNESFDFNRHSAGNSECGEVRFRVERVSNTLTERITVSGTAPGGRTWSRTMSEQQARDQFCQRGTYGLHNGLFYVLVEGNRDQAVISALDPATGETVWSNSDALPHVSVAHFLPSGNILQVTGWDNGWGSYSIIGPGGQTLVRDVHPQPLRLQWIDDYSYWNGTITFHTTEGLVVTVDVSRYV